MSGPYGKERFWRFERPVLMIPSIGTNAIIVMALGPYLFDASKTTQNDVSNFWAPPMPPSGWKPSPLIWPWRVDANGTWRWVEDGEGDFGWLPDALGELRFLAKTCPRRHHEGLLSSVSIR